MASVVVTPLQPPFRQDVMHFEFKGIRKSLTVSIADGERIKALLGNKRAEMVGEPTAGVAALQKLVKLTQGYGLWLTYERYMTVDGKTPIHERGLAPDVPIQNPIVGFDELPPTTDAPLAKAVEQLKAKK